VVGEPGEVADIAVPVAAAAPDTHQQNPAAERDAPGSTKVASPVLRKLAGDLGVDVDSLAGTGPGGRVTRDDVVGAGGRNGRVLAMPKVRKAAREASVDLHTLTGTGPQGAITLADLTGAPAAVTVGARGAGRRERLSATRRAIAKHLIESAQQIPQFTSMVEVDASALVATRAALVARQDGPVPFDAVLMALMIPVLREHPVINAMLDGDEIVYHDRFHIGVAVDTPGGLMLPVVRDADQRTIADLSAEIVRLATAARDRQIQPDELTGATSTLNNVGALGIVAGTPILPLGTSTIVAFGRTRPVLQLRNGNVVEVPTMTISATFDHRLIDGGDSGRFLDQLKQHLEVPALGLLS